MIWVAVDEDGCECVYRSGKPIRKRDYDGGYFAHECGSLSTKLPKGSIKKIIGRELTWADEPVELKDD